MAKYWGKIYDVFVWLTATPSPVAKSLPFHITEAGHFLAYEGYTVRRDLHDSFLILYTIDGEGELEAKGSKILLPKRHAAVIDCHFPHEYKTVGQRWEFLWIHFHGAQMESIWKLLYPREIEAIMLGDRHYFEKKILDIMGKIPKNDILTSMEISCGLHEILSGFCLCRTQKKDTRRLKDHEEDIERVLAFIKEHYSEQITIDDMLEIAHISKYHFIRIFKNKMGTTPYHYLTNYRINQSKLLLCTTSRTVDEIANSCGFLSCSNFIVQFRKQTGQNPLQYRQDFG